MGEVVSMMRGNGLRSHLLTDRSFHTYFNEVGATKILDPETERKLFKRYKQRKDLAARDRLLESCLRFVVKLAHRFTNNVDLMKDLLAAGNLGLMRALDRFDPNRNTRFLSYATNWVLLEMREELHDTEQVSMPRWRQKAISKIKRVQARIRAREGIEADIERLSDETDLTTEQVASLKIEALHFKPLADHIASVPENLDENVLSAERKAIIKQLVDHLPARERFVVRAYFGMGSTETPMNLKQIATFLGVTSERVRQIKADGLDKIERYLRRERIVEKTWCGVF